jgi:hypothetical protein
MALVFAVNFAACMLILGFAMYKRVQAGRAAELVRD